MFEARAAGLSAARRGQPDPRYRRSDILHTFALQAHDVAKTADHIGLDIIRDAALPQVTANSIGDLSLGDAMDHDDPANRVADLCLGHGRRGLGMVADTAAACRLLTRAAVRHVMWGQQVCPRLSHNMNVCFQAR